MPTRIPELPARTIRALVRTARECVTTIGARVLDSWTIQPRSDVHRKGAGDFVTAVDLRTERALRKALLERHPDHGFLGEESAAFRTDADFVWVVDPIDGTSNFSQALPCFAVSAACLFRGLPVATAVLAAPRGELFVAGRGLGAHLGRRRLQLARTRLDDAAVIGVQWLRGVHEPALHAALAASGARVRVFGSTITQICDVAAGRLHANVQTQGRIWDLAAPLLVATEAGARATDWSGAPLLPFRDLDPTLHHPSLVGPAAIHAALRALIVPPT